MSVPHAFADAPTPPPRSPLIEHPSAYLRLHAADPVRWRLWSPTLLDEAQRQNKLIFISSGYFACHWCHVMRAESFSNRAIAEQLNRDYLPVKVDRELEPVLDSYLIAFTERTYGAAGWPLNVFVTPRGNPLLGFVYLPPEEFESVLTQLNERWRSEGETLSEMAASDARERAKAAAVATTPRAELVTRMRDRFFAAVKAGADTLAGGFGDQARFPRPALLEQLLREPGPYATFVRLTLDAMAEQGLHDHLGGGFFRYTVDPAWQQPHFEKMLYDNALLATLYFDAADRLNEPRYRTVGETTLRFMLRRMASRDGGFIASLSAVDNANIEGGYYLWRADALRTALPTNLLEAAKRYWGLDGAAPFEAGGLPIPHPPSGLSASQIETSRSLMLKARDKRGLPRDDKVLTGWNGLALTALARGWQAGLRDDEIRNAGDRLVALFDDRSRNGRVARIDGEEAPSALLEDYAYAAQGLMAWHRATGNEPARTLARRYLRDAFSHFYRAGNWQLQETPPLPYAGRAVVIAEDPTPSPIVVVLTVALQLDERPVGLPLDEAMTAIASHGAELLDDPTSYPGYLRLLQSY